MLPPRPVHVGLQVVGFLVERIDHLDHEVPAPVMCPSFDEPLIALQMKLVQAGQDVFRDEDQIGACLAAARQAVGIAAAYLVDEFCPQGEFIPGHAAQDGDKVVEHLHATAPRAERMPPALALLVCDQPPECFGIIHVDPVVFRKVVR